MTSAADSRAEPSPQPSEGSLERIMEWEVQDILAARTSATGDDEMLVVWKPSWTPVGNIKDGPALRSFKNATKFKFTSTAAVGWEGVGRGKGALSDGQRTFTALS